MTNLVQFIRALQRHTEVTDTADESVLFTLAANDRPYFRSSVRIHPDETASGTLRVGTVPKEVDEMKLRASLQEYASPLDSYTLRLTLAGDIRENPPADPKTNWFPHLEFDCADPLDVVAVVANLQERPNIV